MATTRLRKTFQYPGDEDEDELPEHMDEEEQEKFIEQLREEDEKRNAFYTKSFVIVLLLLNLAYIHPVYNARSFQHILLSLLGVTSLLSSAYSLWYMPLRAKPDPKGKRPLRPGMDFEVGEWGGGPIEQYLGVLNAGLCALLALAAVRLKGRSSAPDGFWILCLLPGVASALVFTAKRTMLLVDVAELENLRYRYKGA
ncbi:hypothetical protein L228DRAFT_280741 [Xylona heveae TC161]|uniref:Transmembrane protein n=1 Tax=Xylona heveae (strain CBS 132557 / TC161) TaxID=1328760 RepID=A0A165IX93_XYLHT|nr:hypothetical protein L228DRAFT_280741 [Xylona heveae TC161]KZF25501.1 hypothetical protein L228DRAFT_280741 [Xylona heveae TC161]